MTDAPAQRSSVWSIFLIFLRLGLTSFGGPVAHLGYFREEFVARRQWLSERDYADLVALCQFLPGPASSQVGMALGLGRGGYAGALAAWLGFTLPSAVLLILFALGITHYGDVLPSGALHGLKVVAVAVVAQAVWGMARHLCPDVPRVSIMVAAACAVLLFSSTWTQVGVIICAGVLGLWLFNTAMFNAARDTALHPPVTSASKTQHHRRSGVLWLSVFAALLIALPIFSHVFSSHILAVIDAFYRAGSLVFGGGHVVLPLLQAEVVPTGWVNEDAFLAGYGAAQAVPGPLFTFAAFLGASMPGFSSDWLGGFIAVVAIFLPSFLLIAGALPYWDVWRRNDRVQAALTGVNAGVVGLLLAALYDPVWTSAIYSVQDFALALVALIALMFWKLPPWLVVIACGFAGWGLSVAV
jgi:chromate transporter